MGLVLPFEIVGKRVVFSPHSGTLSFGWFVGDLPSRFLRWDALMRQAWFIIGCHAGTPSGKNSFVESHQLMGRWHPLTNHQRPGDLKDLASWNLACKCGTEENDGRRPVASHNKARKV